MSPSEAWRHLQPPLAVPCRRPNIEQRGITSVHCLDVHDSMPTRNAQPLSAEDYRVLRFVIQWAPYGGPLDEDVLPLFGLTHVALSQRARAIALRAARSPSADDRLLSARTLAVLPAANDAAPISSPVQAAETETPDAAVILQLLADLDVNG